MNAPRVCAPVLVLASLIGMTGHDAHGAPAQQRQARVDANACAEGSGIAGVDIITCSRAIRFGGHSPATLSTLYAARGRAKRMTGRLTAALSDQVAAVDANPLSAVALHGRALVHLDLGNLAAARADLDRALALNPYYPGAWRDSGWVRFLSADDDGATRDLERAIQIHGNDAEAHAFLGFVAFRQGRFDAAARSFQLSERWQLGYEYGPVWEYLASARAGNDDKNRLRRALDALHAQAWPWMLIKALIGEAGDAQVMEAAAQAAARLRDTRRVQAEFYLAQRDLLAGQPQAAARRFAAVRAADLAITVERAMLPTLR